MIRKYSSDHDVKPTEKETLLTTGPGNQTYCAHYVEHPSHLVETELAVFQSL